MRGLPGSGKSRKAYNINFDRYNNAEVSVILSTDDLWYDYDGNFYLWNPTAIGAAHRVNQAKCCQAMVKGIQLVIIDNTNITQEDMQPYIDFAWRFDYSIELEEPETDWKIDVAICAKKTAHGVPIEVIQRMKNKWIDSEDVAVDYPKIN